MKNYILSFFSAILLSLAWPVSGYSFFIFFAFVPLLYVIESISVSLENGSGKKVYLFSAITFLLFNFLTTYWVYHATMFGVVIAFLVNTFLMSSVFYLFFKSKKYFSSRLSYIGLVVFWISMEFFHLNWDLSWPWLNLGNCFSESVFLVQWYEYTGALGGSLWVLVVNILIFRVLKKPKDLKLVSLVLMVVILPIVFSFIIKSQNNELQKESQNIVIVQPNINSYTEKFSLSYQSQLHDFIELAKTKIDSTTDLLIGPETALVESLWESKIEYSYSIRKLKDLQKDFPNLSILIGATTYKAYNSIDDKSVTSRQLRHQDIWYDAYNSAIFISKSGDLDVYHKTKLVPGAEKIPFPYLLNNISALSVDLGGVSGSLGSDNYLNSFDMQGYSVLPLICYESIYGDLNTSKEFDFMCVITNDGWWGNTSGYKQHFSYAKLRAIEQRRAVVRSANTGQSGVINTNGDVIAFSDWNQKTAIASIVPIGNKKTFYNTNGDYIGRISFFISSILLLMIFVKSKVK